MSIKPLSNSIFKLIKDEFDINPVFLIFSNFDPTKLLSLVGSKVSAMPLLQPPEHS
jgi:hypothetical protein